MANKLSVAMGSSTGLDSLVKEAGRIIFTTDEGQFYVDTSGNTRIAVNANHAKTAGSATSASSAAKWTTARTFTVGSTGKTVDGSEPVSWSHAEIGATVAAAFGAGTAEGPELTVTVNGVNSTPAKIPAASGTASGIVTTGKQTFAGIKTFSSEISGSVSGYAGHLKTPQTFSINSVASDSTITFDGTDIAKLNLPKILSGFTSISATTFDGNATTATTADKTAGTLSIKLNGGTATTFNGSSSPEINITPAGIGALPAGTLYAGSTSAGGPANKVKSKLTLQIGGTEKAVFDGSAAKTFNVTAADLGLSSAMHFIGTTTTTLTDGGTTSSITVGSITYVTGTPTSGQKKINAGDVVLNGNKEFVWTGSAWEVLGDEGSYALKTVSINVDGVALTGGGTLAASRTISHKDDYNTGTVGTAASTTSINGSGKSGTLKIPNITVDKYGHTTYTGDTSVSIAMPTLHNLVLKTVTTAATTDTSDITYDPDSASATFTVYRMAGATASEVGHQGLVPAPAIGDNEKVLFGNATWKYAVEWVDF